jgi:hypothetical protein
MTLDEDSKQHRQAAELLNGAATQRLIFVVWAFSLREVWCSGVGRACRLLAQRASPPFGARGQSTKNLHPHSQALEVFHLAMQQGLAFLRCSLTSCRCFPPPWTVQQIPGGYKVLDATGTSMGAGQRPRRHGACAHHGRGEAYREQHRQAAKATW